MLPKHAIAQQLEEQIERMHGLAESQTEWMGWLEKQTERMGKAGARLRSHGAACHYLAKSWRWQPLRWPAFGLSRHEVRSLTLANNNAISIIECHPLTDEENLR